MKKKLLFIPLVFLLCACSYDKYEMPKDAFINTNEKEYKVYSTDGKLYDLIGDTNTEILSKNKILNTDEIGEQEVEVSYKYKKRDYLYKIKYTVIDDEAPIMLSSKSNVTFSPSSNTLNPSMFNAEKCTNTSFPSSSVINPNPFFALNHLTVPSMLKAS